MCLSVDITSLLRLSPCSAILQGRNKDMAVNTSKIDAAIAKQQEHIKKLQELKRFAADPEMLPLLESLIGQNGTPRVSRTQTKRSRRGHKKGDLTRAACKAILGLHGKFTVTDVVE